MAFRSMRLRCHQARTATILRHGTLHRSLLGHAAFDMGVERKIVALHAVQSGALAGHPNLELELIIMKTMPTGKRTCRP